MTNRCKKLCIAGLVFLLVCMVVFPREAREVPVPTDVITLQQAPDPGNVYKMSFQDVHITSFNEAPMLKELVEAGKLPPVEQRLPSNPQVIKPYEYIGVYSDTLRTWCSVPGGPWYNAVWFQGERMNRLDPNNLESFDLHPDIAERMEVSDDMRTYTYYLREGHRWSDGAPFTTDDIAFYWNDVMGNPTLRGALGYVVAPGRLEVLDKTTFKIVFDEPNAIFELINSVDMFSVVQWINHPKHYLSRFHPAYASEAALKAEMDKAGAGSWEILYRDKVTFALNPDLPVLSAWKVERPPDEAGTWIYVRNPYYFKVDIEGNQLPYIDRLRFDRMTNDAAIVAAFAGEIDYNWVDFRTPDLPALKAGEPTAPIRVGNNVNVKGGEDSMFMNLTHPNPRIAAVVSDVRFRQAVSVAIDRKAIVDTLFYGLAEPRQMSPTTLSPLYDPNSGWEHHYAQHDPALANRLLDEMGLDRRDARGMRLGLDGSPLSLIFVEDITRGETFIDKGQMIVDYLRDVGLNVVLRPEPSATYWGRIDRGDYGFITRSIMPEFQDRRFMLPMYSPSYATEWSRWIMSGGERGERPEEDVLRINQLVQKAYSSPASFDHFISMLQEAGRIFQDNLYVLGIFGNDKRPEVVHDRMMNVRFDDVMPFGSWLNGPSLTHYLEQFFIDPNYKMR